MIPQAFIVEWQGSAPWLADSQVEQDLVLSRVLVEVFYKPGMRENLAFRGGTALYKLQLPVAWRYSEDIDLVQMKPGPIGSTLNELRKAIDPLLGSPSWEQKEESIILQYRFASEIPPIVPLRLKIEINTREHFAVMGIHRKRFVVKSRWFSGECELCTFTLEELLGTKLRALYQRRKGRDLFDLWIGLTEGKADPISIVKVFKHYMENGGNRVSRNDFLKNLETKMKNRFFHQDTTGLLRPGIKYDPEIACAMVKERLIELLK